MSYQNERVDKDVIINEIKALLNLQRKIVVGVYPASLYKDCLVSIAVSLTEYLFADGCRA